MERFFTVIMAPIAACVLLLICFRWLCIKLVAHERRMEAERRKANDELMAQLDAERVERRKNIRRVHSAVAAVPRRSTDVSDVHYAAPEPSKLGESTLQLDDAIGAALADLGSAPECVPSRRDLSDATDWTSTVFPAPVSDSGGCSSSDSSTSSSSDSGSCYGSGD